MRSQRLPFGDESPRGTGAAPAGARRATDGSEPRAATPASDGPTAAVPAGVTIAGTPTADARPPGPALPPADPFATQLAELCRAHPARAKWVLVPTHAAGHTLGDRLARHGASWANLRFVTPLQVAIHMAGPFLVERGIDPSEEPLGPALVMRLLTELPATHDYFRPMADHTTLAVALWSTLRELRFAGLRAADLRALAPGMFASAAKHTELVALVEAYERYLAAANVADMAVVFEEAPGHADFCPIQPGDLWTELPGVAWPPLVRRFLDALPGERVAPRALGVPGLDPPPRLAALSARAERVSPAAVTDAARLRFLRAPEQAGPALDDGTLDLFHAGGRDAEIEEVCRRILASGRPLDQVEIVCASDAHASLAWEKARRLDWPVTIAGGLPAAATRPGRALLAWCAWIEGGFVAADLRRLLQSGDLAPQAFGGNEGGGAGHPIGRDETGAAGGPAAAQASEPGGPRLTTSQAARVLLRAEATWGRDTYARALAAYATREETRARQEDEEAAGWRRQRAAQARRLLAWIDTLLADVPEPDAEGMVLLPAVLGAARRFLAQNASRGSDLDAAARVALADALAALDALGAARLEPALALRFVREAVEGRRLGGRRAAPGHLHVSALTGPDAGFDARPLVFVVGLEEARVFPTAVEDPVLLDGERRAIARACGDDTLLRTSADRLDEAVHAVVSRLAALGATAEGITLSFSCVDAREFRETFPSWLVLQAYRLKAGDAHLTYDHLRKWLGEPASAVPPAPDRATSDAGWWLQTGRAGERAAAAVSAAFPNVERGLAATRGRASDAFTGFDGFAPEAGAALDPTRRGRAVSPTTLEDTAKCPFRFFLKSGLGIEAIDDGERDADVWLDPLTRGSELHALYAALTRRARDAGRRVSRKDDLDWFLALGRARLAELRRDMPPPSEEVYAAESAELVQDLEAFIEAEERLRDVEPIAFEVSFGRTLEEGAEALARPEPVPITIGGTRRLYLAGRLDRVDRVGRAADHAYQVVDYKTGRFWPPDYVGTVVRGRLLQHALYGRAAEALLAQIDAKARVTRGVYWFPTGRGWGKLVLIPAPSQAALAEALGDLADLVGTGAFTHAPDEKVCERCDFRAACGRQPWADAARKIAANEDERLAPWIRLQERE